MPEYNCIRSQLPGFFGLIPEVLCRSALLRGLKRTHFSTESNPFVFIIFITYFLDNQIILLFDSLFGIHFYLLDFHSVLSESPSFTDKCNF